MKEQKEPELLPLDPETQTLDCSDADLGDVRFRLACTGYKIELEEPTPTGWRILARRCDCEVCAAGRVARAKAKAAPKNDAPVTRDDGQRFFNELRRKLRQP